MNDSALQDVLARLTEPTLLGLALIALAVAAGGMWAARAWVRHRRDRQGLRDSHTRMKALLDTAVDGVVILDSKGRIVEFNASAERIFGWRKPDILGAHITVLMVPSIRARHMTFLQDYLTTGEAEFIGRGKEIQGVRKDGASMPIRLAVGHAHLPDQDVFVGFITDISDRVEMETAMRVSEQQLRSLVRNIPGICFRLLAAEPRATLFISNAVERFTGYPATDFLGQPARRQLSDHIHAEDRLSTRTAMAQALASDRDFHMQYRMLHRDGSQRWVWSSGSGVRDAAGRVKWIDGIVLDITERHEMEAQVRLAKEAAERAAQARSDFLANMSHEIRTPLNAILGFADLMLNNSPQPDERRYLHTIRSAGDSLLHLLNDVLDSAKLDRGVVGLEEQAFDLYQLVYDLREILAHSAVAKGLALTVTIAPDVPRVVRGDRYRIGQVLTNLLGNAIKFTSEGQVHLEMSRVQDGVHFCISDTGIGIASDRLEAIFEPFVQADASMSRRFGGTGLGTTICRQLVTLMGGRIWAESELGEGSAFHVVLALPDSHDPAGAQADAAWQDTRRLRVLVADDVPQNLELITLMLGQLGHDVVRVGDGAAAVQAVKDGDYDVVLMDLHMSGTSGLDAARQIRAHELGRARQTPVVALTAAVLPDDRIAAMAAGMVGFLAKPLQLRALKDELARVVAPASAPGAASRSAPDPLLIAQAAQQAIAARSSPRGEVMSEAAIESAPVSSLAVLDHETGLARWGGDLHLYTGSLAEFARVHSQAGRLLTAHLKSGEIVEMTALAHKLRGVAATLGLDQLAERLARLERAEMRPAQYGSGQILVSDVSAALKEACEAIARYVAQLGVSGKTVMSQHEQHGSLAHLAYRLAEPLSRATLDKRAWNEFRAQVPQHTPGMDALAAAIDDLDLPLAYEKLQQVLAALNVPGQVDTP